jgi:restriction system protein
MADLAAAVGLGGDCLADIAVLREPPWRLTIRDFLAHWGQTRRTGTVNALIRSDLADKGLTTRPPFTEGRVEDEIEIIPAIRHPETLRPSREGESQDTEDVAEQVSAAMS